MSDRLLIELLPEKPLWYYVMDFFRDALLEQADQSVGRFLYVQIAVGCL